MNIELRKVKFFLIGVLLCVFIGSVMAEMTSEKKLSTDTMINTVQNFCIDHLRTFLMGHQDRANSVAFSPDGNYLVSGYYTMTDHKKNLLLWDVQSGELIYDLVGHEGSIFSVAFSPNGKYIVSCSNDDYDARLIMWDAHTGEKIHNLMGHSGYVLSVAFSPDGKYIVSGGQGKKNNLIMWDVQSGKKIYNFVGHEWHIESVAFSPDGKYIVSGGNEGYGQNNLTLKNNLMLWNVASGRLVHSFVGQQKEYTTITKVAFSPDGKYIVSGSDSGSNNLMVWNVKLGNKKYNLVEGQRAVQDVAFSPDGRYIVAGSKGDQNNLMVWSMESGRLVHNLVGHYGGVSSVAISPDGKYIASGGGKGSEVARNNLMIWSMESGRLVHNFVKYDNGVNSVAFSHDGKYIASGSCRGRSPLVLWNVMPLHMHDLNPEQVRLLYQLYLTVDRGHELYLIENSHEYAVYQTFPEDVKNIVGKVFKVFTKVIVEQPKKMEIVKQNLYQQPGISWFSWDNLANNSITKKIYEYYKKFF